MPIDRLLMLSKKYELTTAVWDNAGLKRIVAMDNLWGTRITPQLSETEALEKAMQDNGQYAMLNIDIEIKREIPKRWGSDATFEIKKNSYRFFEVDEEKVRGVTWEFLIALPDIVIHQR